MTWLLDRLQRLPCVFRGHDNVMHFERDRLSLRCLSCGYRTPGWSLGPDVGYAPSPIHEFSLQREEDHASPPVIFEKTSGSAFAARDSHADRLVGQSAARRPGALGGDRKSRAIGLAS
jgi:hypothetical protein